MYIRKEAVLSSQIEGTQASLADVLEYEAGTHLQSHRTRADVEETFNYVRAMNKGLDRLATLPLSLRLLREIHAELLQGVRGEFRSPGQFRTTQNWIGPEGTTLNEAAFVPPPADEMNESLHDLERYVRESVNTPTLIRCGIAHAQFETIHPFLDGNGRLGRLLVTFMLCERGVLRRPLLYLSAHFKRHQKEYYEWLMRVRENGDWEGWLRFFLRGVHEVSDEAARTAREILALQREHGLLVRERLPNSPSASKLLESLYERPVLDVKTAASTIQVQIPTANSLVAEFERLGILREVTGQRRNRVFRYQRYLDVLTPP